MHVNAVIVDKSCERVDLFHAGELHFIDHQDPDVVGEELFNRPRKICVRFDGFSFGLDADAARHHALGAAVAKGPQGHVAAALA